MVFLRGRSLDAPPLSLPPCRPRRAPAPPPAAGGRGCAGWSCLGEEERNVLFFLFVRWIREFLGVWPEVLRDGGGWRAGRGRKGGRKERGQRKQKKTPQPRLAAVFALSFLASPPFRLCTFLLERGDRGDREAGEGGGEHGWGVWVSNMEGGKRREWAACADQPLTSPFFSFLFDTTIHLNPTMAAVQDFLVSALQVPRALIAASLGLGIFSFLFTVRFCFVFVATLTLSRARARQPRAFRAQAGLFDAWVVRH